VPNEPSASASEAPDGVSPGDPDALAALLIDAEQRLARLPDLEERIADLERELAHTRNQLAASQEEVQRLDQLLMYGRRMLRLVRPLIAPLRDARRRRHG
jgi:predicted  nucleic acid-binding Zn-ribbon protein